ncbi:MBL fold metallo-hydrolase [Natronorubrum sp. FCH18a]|uniref:MBL fold metallo-hydrolase n=1 Tax=Natronorubrum sp. FCH18a TaxID=3447018 RepID=UPI003F513E5A
MKGTLLGTGSPVPLPDRAGTSILVSVGGEKLLFDCGPGTVTRLLENGINPGSIDRLFFTHHHIDHNADFYNFVVANWARGDSQGALRIHGPSPWTDSLLESLYDIYEEDIEYREDVGYPTSGIWDIETSPINHGSVVETDRWRVEARAVDHSIETYGYRITDEETGHEIAFSGDTRKCDSVISLAEGADVLVQDCCIAPVTADPPSNSETFVWDTYTEAMPDEKREGLHQTHCDPTEAGEIAAAAGVETVVLTHLLPYRDEEVMQDAASSAFDGTVIVAEDGLEIGTETVDVTAKER